MGLSGMQQAQDISPLFQLVIQILPLPRRGFHPNANLTGCRIHLAQFFLPELPALPGIGKRKRFDSHACVGPQNAAHAGLASDVHPTDRLDRQFLWGERRCRRFHRTPAFWLSSLMQPFDRWQPETRPTRASVSSCWIGNLTRRLSTRETLWWVHQAS